MGCGVWGEGCGVWGVGVGIRVSHVSERRPWSFQSANMARELTIVISGTKEASSSPGGVAAWGSGLRAVGAGRWSCLARRVRADGAGFMVEVSGFRDVDLGLRVKGLGVRVQELGLGFSRVGVQ